MATMIRIHLDLVVMIFLGIFSSGGCEVCVANKSCVLPCRFQAGQEVVIHWIYLDSTDEATVHSYYHSRDQLEYQNQDFRSRTRLFMQQIAEGNASLLLSGVRLKDQGRYKCYTSTSTRNAESFVNVQVEAPVDEVHIQQLGSQVSCRAEGIYPEPQLTWSTWPPSSLSPDQEPSVQVTPEQLYTIRSSLTLDHTSSTTQDGSYSCTVGTASSSRTATLFLKASLTSSSEVTIPCTSWGLDLDLVWRFNHTEVILRRTSSSRDVSESWRQQVEQASPSGDLALKDLEPRHSGFYTCTLSNNVTQTHLTVHASGDSRPNVGIIAAIFIVLGVLAIAVGGVALMKRRQKAKRKERRKEEVPLQD
ncbi:uncharacterized protein LOC142903402 [Nelusetta ayraudi]|uniref:uncharacterized protein LOC142903402 n=1 Tax=Nelusetta ayraudi TaxID=303726 RepID=UPI003F703795